MEIPELKKLVKTILVTVMVGLFMLASGQVPAEGSFSFFGDGLDNEEMEEITLHRPGWEDDVALEEEWDPSEVVENYSREKIDVTGPNVNDNWEISEREGGTPGELAAGGGDWNAHYLADWAWGGEIADGVSVGDTVYVPSFSDSFQEGDFGYFRITAIHDESGKQDLDNPREVDCEGADYDGCVLGEHLDTGRTMRIYSFAEEIMERDVEWVTTMDLMHVGHIGPERIAAFRPSYSAYRKSEAERVNINTASWEALMGIQIADGDPPEFMTDDMARELIEIRSGSGDVDGDLPVDSTTDDEYPELGPEYVTNQADTFSHVTEACDVLEDENDFDCNVFSQYAMTGSEGLLWVEITGGRLNTEGDVMSSTHLQALVDRRPLALGEPLEVVYKRIW